MKVCVVVTARPSWAKLLTLCEALRARPDVELQIVACASALLERYGRVVDVIQAQGFSIAAEVYSVYEGENLLTSAAETGALLCGIAPVLRRLQPSCCVVCADRHEVLGVAQAASYQHLAVVHVQGGERTGSIDDRVRDSITHLSTYHFTCTELAKYRVYGLTGAADRIWNMGCGSIDLAKRALEEPPVTGDEIGGTGPWLDTSQPFLLVLQHPDTRSADAAGAQMRTTLEALPAHVPALVLWPGQDAGSNAMSKAIREHALVHPIHTLRNLPPMRFLKLLTQCAVIVGNSSASVREAAYVGTPAVVIGTRQWGRERGSNVIDVPHDVLKIRQAIERQIAHGRYPSSALYGSGNAGERIAEVLTRVCDRADTRSVG
jgi:UDP-hydrolysing UDP-N-acetyl-D-glucosamine 2-epimerase